MLNKLDNCYITSHIFELPTIINGNNEKIKNEFANTYNSSLNLLTKSIYAPTGQVKTFFGDFGEVKAEYITVKNIESFKACIYNVGIKALGSYLTPHNQMNGRWSSIDAEEQYKDTEFTHDAKSIVYSPNVTLYDKIQVIQDGTLNFVSETGEVYTNNDLGETIEWKESLQTVPFIVVSDIGQIKKYNVLCTSIIESNYPQTANVFFNSMSGVDTEIKEETDEEINSTPIIATNIYEGQPDEVDLTSDLINSTPEDNTNTNDVSTK